MAPHVFFSKKVTDLNWKNVKYCTMETVNICSNFRKEISSLKHLIISFMTVFVKNDPFYVFSRPQNGQKEKIVIFVFFNNFETLTYIIVNILELII